MVCALWGAKNDKCAVCAGLGLLHYLYRTGHVIHMPSSSLCGSDALALLHAILAAISHRSIQAILG